MHFKNKPVLKNFQIFISGLLVVVLVGCGGGGGSGGTPSSGSGSTPSTSASTVVVGTPTLAIALINTAGVATNFVTASGLISAKVTFKDAEGKAVTGTKVTFTGDPLLIKISPANDVLTDSSGVATVQISATSLIAKGAGTLRASSSVAGVVVTGSIDFQLSPVNLTLSALDLGSNLGALSAFGNRTVAVVANIDGVAATSIPVQVTFAATCGVVSPTTVITDGTGKASSTYSANSVNCAGSNVIVTASAVGATPVSGAVTVAESVATNVQFISSSPQLIYLKDSVGTTQAQVVFRTVDSIGNPLQNKKLRLSLSNVSTGVSLNVLGNTLPVDLTTDVNGQVTAAVFSGTVPTSLNVKAILLDAANQPTVLFSSSNLLTVASGRPTQSALSISVGARSIEGNNIDGVTTTVTLSMADRQGNPVPPGTQVNFVVESGVLLPAVCFVPPVIPATANSPAIPVSSCTVKFSSSGTRTANGRVSILAYTAGEEDFVDNNGNNIYDAGDTFTDLGRAFRDDNAQSFAGQNGVYDSGEFQVPRLLAPACVNGVGCAGDGVWGAADVRQQATLILATGRAAMTAVFRAPILILPSVPPVSPSTVTTPISTAVPGVVFEISDLNGNSVPTASVINLTTTDNSPSDPVTIRGSSTGATCSLSGPSSFTVANSLNKLFLDVALVTCTRGDAINLVVTTPLGFVSTASFIIP